MELLKWKTQMTVLDDGIFPIITCSVREFRELSDKPFPAPFGKSELLSI